MRARELGLLVALGAIWGMSYVFIRIASPAIGPAVLMELRFAITASIFAVYLAALGLLKPSGHDLRARWKEYALMGVISGAIPTTLIGVAELEITASVASILNALVPFFALAGARLWLKEPWRARTGVGLVLGFGGVLLVVGGGSFPLNSLTLVGCALSIVAAASYGVGSVYTSRSFRETPRLQLAFGLSVVSALVLLPVAGVTAPAPTIGPEVVYSIVGLAILSTTIAYLIFYHLIRTIGPTQATTVTFLIPVFGVVGGHFLLAEPLGPGLVLGLAVILVGLALVTGIGARKPDQPRLEAAA